jgi:hypothetical protein
MSIFKVNKWLLFFCIAFPFLCLSQIRGVIAILYFVCFILLLISISDLEKELNLRIKIESIFFIVLLFIYIVLCFWDKSITMFTGGSLENAFFSILYFAALGDLSINLSRILSSQYGKGILKRRVLFIFLSLFILPLGIFYLRKLYFESINVSKEQYSSQEKSFY